MIIAIPTTRGFYSGLKGTCDCCGSFGDVVIFDLRIGSITLCNECYYRALFDGYLIFKAIPKGEEESSCSMCGIVKKVIRIARSFKVCKRCLKRIRTSKPKLLEFGRKIAPTL